jgi:hypothetical protein
MKDKGGYLQSRHIVVRYLYLISGIWYYLRYKIPNGIIDLEVHFTKPSIVAGKIYIF